MKLLLITSSFPQNNRISGMFILDTIKALNRLGVDAHILTQNCDSRETYTELFWPGCKVTYFGWNGGEIPIVSLLGKGVYGKTLAVQYFINAFFTGKNICKDWKPDTIFAEWLIPAGLIAALLSKYCRIPYCARSLGSDVYISAQKALLRPFIKYAAKHASFLFADGFDLCKKTSALANGAECNFAATARKMSGGKSTFQSRRQPELFTFCCIGRLHNVKGQDVLIKACELLSKKGINFRCYLVGAGNEKNNLERMINDLSLSESVLLAGRLEDGDIAELLQNIDCVVIPSRSESIPMILLEAVAAKKPLVVTDVGDMRLLAEKFNLGYVAKREDFIDLAEFLIKMNDPEIRNSFYNKERYEELMSLLSIESGANVIYHKIKGLQSSL
jgi:glycosyltransferase involved in cell wall biosynthesis